MTVGIGEEQSCTLKTPLANHYFHKVRYNRSRGFNSIPDTSDRNPSMSETHFRKANSVNDRELEEEVKQLTVCSEYIIY